MQEVTGIYTNNFDLSLNTKNGFPVFATVVEANYVTKKQDLFSAYKLTQEDKEEIEKLAKDSRIGERVIFLLHYLFVNYFCFIIIKYHTKSAMNTFRLSSPLPRQSMAMKI